MGFRVWDLGFPGQAWLRARGFTGSELKNESAHDEFGSGSCSGSDLCLLNIAFEWAFEPCRLLLQVYCNVFC